ncbi:hypothetical protein GGX14DRAFT_399223 [Mycena pura]|uniref:Uncharacterized protein n=1 Tax=Mycena pura TaxID=153505 RepID=A0AAD6YCT3_9AGAR|nr:hypothetical protein GGX14DRAFT_399223 [Mycena pura]
MSRSYVATLQVRVRFRAAELFCERPARLPGTSPSPPRPRVADSTLAASLGLCYVMLCYTKSSTREPPIWRMTRPWWSFTGFAAAGALPVLQGPKGRRGRGGSARAEESSSCSDARVTTGALPTFQSGPGMGARVERGRGGTVVLFGHADGSESAPRLESRGLTDRRSGGELRRRGRRHGRACTTANSNSQNSKCSDATSNEATTQRNNIPGSRKLLLGLGRVKAQLQDKNNKGVSIRPARHQVTSFNCRVVLPLDGRNFLPQVVPNDIPVWLDGNVEEDPPRVGDDDIAMLWAIADIERTAAATRIELPELPSVLGKRWLQTEFDQIRP